MADAWGGSWGGAWGNSWGSTIPTPVIPSGVGPGYRYALPDVPEIPRKGKKRNRDKDVDIALAMLLLEDDA